MEIRNGTPHQNSISRSTRVGLQQPPQFLKSGQRSSRNTPFRLTRFTYKTQRDPKTNEEVDVSELTLKNIKPSKSIVLIYNRLTGHGNESSAWMKRDNLTALWSLFWRSIVYLPLTLTIFLTLVLSVQPVCAVSFLIWAVITTFTGFGFDATAASCTRSLGY